MLCTAAFPSATHTGRGAWQRWPSALVVAAAAFWLGACSNALDSAALGIHYEPPSGVKLTSEEPGPPVVARFSGGLEIRGAPGSLPKPEQDNLAAILQQALEKAGVPALTTPTSDARAGTCALGPVARYETRGTKPMLIYVIPQGAQFILMLFQADSTDGKAEAQFERSLGSLRPLAKP